MNAFQYKMNQKVRIRASGETGCIVGVACYASRPEHPMYFLRYKNGQGCAVEEWWDESAIEADSHDKITVHTVSFKGGPE